MTLKEKTAALLEANRGKYLSGEEIAAKLGVSRTAVWKAIKSLKESGFEVKAVTNKGYCMSCDNDILSESGIKKYLKSEISVYLKIFDSVSSTNTVLRELAQNGAPEGTVIISSSQTNGRGRFGRNFYSPDKSGIYMSILLRPNMSAEKATLITTAAAVAVCEAAETVSGRKCGIKWVNDVLIDGKKVGGILTEAALNIESASLDYAVLGIGINAYEPADGFADDIKNIAGPVFIKEGGDLKNRLTAEIINRFSHFYTALENKTYLSSYRKHCIVFGRKITVLSHGNASNATALSVDDDCRLLVRYDDGKEEYLSSGEISIKL